MSLARATPLVIDASAFGEFFLGTELGVEIGTIITAPDSQLHTPALCDVELCSGMRRAVRSGRIDAERAIDALTDYLVFPLTKHGHSALIARIFDLRDNLAASDATYVALCEVMSATLVTCDARLTRAVQRFLPLNVIGVAP